MKNKKNNKGQRKKTKRVAQGAHNYAESIINTVREPLIVLDQDLRVVSVSRSFYVFFKVKPEETVGQLIYDLGNKQWDIPKLRELLETILPQKATFDNYEVEHDFTTIGRRIMLLNARQIEGGMGKERIILLAIEDITERKEIEAGLEKTNKELQGLAVELKRTARAKSEFLANMSHELRTPLNSINGFSEILFDETFGPLNEKQKLYVNNILTSGKHLLLLINQILDMAKVESGKMKLTLSNLPMKGLLNEISLLVADMAGKKKLQIVLEIAEDLPDIEGDELKVKEILYNLLSNAGKFTPEGGKIGMRAKRTDSEIEIVVWDTGIGIAPENMGKLFEGFFRVDTPYSRVTEGTGLGLPLSKKLVELHGGKFSVESEGLNKGTQVRFTLPITSKKVEVKKKALVVDDNENNRMLENDLLENAGFEVFDAENAAGGIAIARKERPDIIIMDVRLPDMRGSEAARILREDKETSDIPIVFVTASVMAEDKEEINCIPNSGFIGKPINTRTFANEISQFIK